MCINQKTGVLISNKRTMKTKTIPTLNRSHDIGAFCGTDYAHESLTFVYFDSMKNRIAATDGRLLMTVEVKECHQGSLPLNSLQYIGKPAESCLIPHEMLSHRLRIISGIDARSYSKTYITAGEPVGTVSLLKAGNEDNINSVLVTSSRQFPDVQKVIPTPSDLPIATIKLDASYLKKICDYFLEHSVNEKNSITLEFRGERQALVVVGKVSAGDLEAKAILMPLAPDDASKVTEK